MIGLDLGAVALRAVLGLLAGYHLLIGLAAVFWPRTAARVSSLLYGAAVAESPQLRYAVRMLGLYAVALGSLLALATSNPAGYRAVVVVAAGLQLARAACRIVFREELLSGFKIPARRNYLSASLLVAEASVLVLAFPR